MIFTFRGIRAYRLQSLIRLSTLIIIMNDTKNDFAPLVPSAGEFIRHFLLTHCSRFVCILVFTNFRYQFVVERSVENVVNIPIHFTSLTALKFETTRMFYVY